MEENDKILLLEKGRRGILKVIFGRTTMILFFMILQVLLLVAVVEYFSRYIPVFFGGYVVFGLCIVLIILNRTEIPEMKLSWAIITLLVPVLGGMLYLYITTHPAHRILERRLNTIYRETDGLTEQSPEVAEALKASDAGTAGLADYVHKNGNSLVYQNTDVTYFPLGEDKFEAMIRELEQAENFIFMEYFIVKEGYMWGRILKILEEKVKQGVEVRVMYDGTCALFELPYKYPEELKELGIQCKMFAPIRPVFSTHYNNRDHRKILVIDGKVGFTGGINLGDEYINRVEKYGHWKDTAVMLKGDAVQGLTLMFLQMWNVTERSEDYKKYLEQVCPVKEAKGFIMPYGDSPFDKELIGETVYMDILNRAKDYVHIMTPYLVIDQQMITALSFAAKRGVDVKLILPHIPDKKYVFALTRSHYKQLLQAGVRIFEYTPGFVHAKVFTSDDEKAVVGTINLDYRSLYLHFECASFLYQVPEIEKIETDYQETLKKSQEITLEDVKKFPLTTHIMGWVLKVIAPLM